MTVERLVLGNWKVNTTRDQAIRIAESLRDGFTRDQVMVGVFPPFPWIEPVREVLAPTGVLLGAQTCAATGNGAYTGEVSAEMLAELCDFILVGHSERRILLRETDEIVHKKLLRVIEAGLKPVLCVGETLEQRHAGNAEMIVTKQMASAFAQIPMDRLKDLVIAYEPVWAIGTGRTASPQDASAICMTICEALIGHGLVDIPVLYGGSVSPSNADSLIAEAGIHGFLVGGASLKPDDFLSIITSASN
jgi:triosephosphate isomerase (TIM)